MCVCTSATPHFYITSMASCVWIEVESSDLNLCINTGPHYVFVPQAIGCRLNMC